MAKIILPFGTWNSPIRPETLGLIHRIDEVRWSPDGRTLLWVEGRSGRGVLVCRQGTEAPRDLTETRLVRGGIGYGGGDFDAANQYAVFAEMDGRLYRVEYSGGQPVPITPAFGANAAPAISPDGKWVLYVHSSDQRDCLAIVDLLGNKWPVKVAEGADFYMQPVWHPSGKSIAWVEWNHPQMPWDGSLIKIADLDPGTPELRNIQTIAGSTDTPVFQPVFSPDGRWMAFLVAEGDMDSLVILELKTGHRKTILRDAVLMEPGWMQGIRVLAWTPDSTKLFCIQNENAFSRLHEISSNNGNAIPVAVSPYTHIEQISLNGTAGRMACIASAAGIPPRIVVQEPDGTQSVQARASAERVPQEDLSRPESISWQSAEDVEIFGLYYPPFHPRFEGKGVPPAILDIHGGPTSQRSASYSADAAYFTSRGYAYLSVNYRGSSGYGYSYQRALYGRWGELDVEDAVGGAKALCERGLADPARLVIKGGSAGGYTVWNALIRHPGFFRAGICLYGVANLFSIASDTHKFEARYLDSVVGPLPGAAEKYRDWSPVFHADSIRDPVAVFQGEEDRVVPPSQTQEMVEALRRNGVPHVFRLFPGEGHGWRKAETIVQYYTEVERFLKQHVVFA